MEMKSGIAIGAAVGLVLTLVGAKIAFARTTTAEPSGNLNVRIDGFEVFTPSGGSPGQYTINGLGQVVGDATGTLTGTLNYTQVSADLAVEDVCSDTVAGTITAPGGSFGLSGGNFTIVLDITGPSSTPACGSATIDLVCNRTLAHHNLVDDLDAGNYHCIATSVTPSGGASTIPASLTVRIGSVDGANAPTD
jgi:hypothetical protein